MTSAEDLVNTKDEDVVVDSDVVIASSSSGLQGGNVARVAQASGQPPVEPTAVAPAKEVSGSTRTLMFHIDEIGDIPIPELMEFNDWQQWRSVTGKRPKQAVDGYTTLSNTEAA